MKIERSCRIEADAAIMQRALRRIICSLFLMAAVTAVASPHANQRLEGVSTALPANIILVTNTNDSGPGSLRDALAVANDGDTIDATSVSGTILLTSGELQITHNATINGPGAGSLAVDGNATFRVFENFAANVTIFGFTITNGLAADGNGGGGILNHGGLILSDSIVSNSHTAAGTGGGISCNGSGTLTVTNSTVSGNSALSPFGAGGGGISGTDGAAVTVTESTINSNSAGCLGAGIQMFNAQLTVTNSTISGNSTGGLPGLCEGGSGGGIHFYNASGGTLTVTNSTISGNEADGNGAQGGGMTLGGSGTAIIRESTLTDNSAPQGGGISNYGTTTIRDTLINAGEFGGTILNDGGTVTSLGYNLASDDGGGVLTGPGDQINTDPLLGPLQDNGGPTFTHALLPGSPAINAGDPSFTPPPFYDQRGSGFDRVVNGRIDIGSFEVQGPPPTPTPTPSATPRVTPRPRPTPHPRPSL